MGYDFIERLQNLIKEKGITQKKLCEDIKISQQSFHDWRSKESYPNGDTIIKLSKYLNVSCDYLLTGTEFENEKKASNEEIKSALLAIIEKL